MIIVKNLFLVLISTLISTLVLAQNNNPTDKPVYLRFPTIPQFTVYKAPDSTAFSRDNLSKRKATIFFIFSPDCGHCQHETEVILKNIRKFKDAQILMITHFPYNEMMPFYKHYKINRYPQITMARDNNYFFPVFFKVENFPSIFVYDKKGNFKKSFEGSVKLEDLLKEL